MSSYKMARRSFIRNCGGSAALLMPLLRTIESRAQGMKAPLRFLVIHHALGTQRDLWVPSAPATTTTYTLPANSAPFAPLQSKMVMIDGLNLVVASQVPATVQQPSHEAGMVTVMTGVPTLGKVATGTQDHVAGGASIDQLLLDRSATLGGAGLSSRTSFGSLQSAAETRADRDDVAARVMSYLPPTTNPDISQARRPLFPEFDPLRVFNRLFGGPLPNGSRATEILAQEQSLLDFMRSDLTRLRAIAPASEKVKLDAHAQAIQDLERSIKASLVPTPGGACAIPMRPSDFTASRTLTAQGAGGWDYWVPGDPTSHPHQTVGQLHLSLIKAAFLCDLARVATFSWSTPSNPVLFPGTFNGARLLTADGQPVQAAAHGITAVSLSEMFSGPSRLSWLAAIDRYYAEQTSLAIQDFAATLDVDGKTLLDNTVIPYISEGAAPAITSRPVSVPVLVFGGANTRIKGGTFLKVTGGPLETPTGGTGNRPFNDLWLALAPVFGVTLPSLGAATQFTGPLPGVVA